MRKGIGLCYRDEAIRVSNPPSIQQTVTCVYKVMEKQAMITLTWLNQGLSIGVSDHPARISISGRRLRGKTTAEVSGLVVEAVWDFSRASYGPGPEPVSGFYLVIVIDSELSLILGDAEPEPGLDTKRVSECVLVSRSERLIGTAAFETAARFCDAGDRHDILIEWRNTTLSVYVDRRSVVQVSRVQWNFRGNHTIFVDGVAVDVMWDVYDWVFGAGAGAGVFLFRTREGTESRRVWMDEGKGGFCLRICACKNPH